MHFRKQFYWWYGIGQLAIDYFNEATGYRHSSPKAFSARFWGFITHGLAQLFTLFYCRYHREWFKALYISLHKISCMRACATIYLFKFWSRWPTFARHGPSTKYIHTLKDIYHAATMGRPHTTPKRVPRSKRFWLPLLAASLISIALRKRLDVIRSPKR